MIVDYLKKIANLDFLTLDLRNTNISPNDAIQFESEIRSCRRICGCSLYISQDEKYWLNNPIQFTVGNSQSGYSKIELFPSDCIEQLLKIIEISHEYSPEKHILLLEGSILCGTTIRNCQIYPGSVVRIIDKHLPDNQYLS